MTRDQAIEAIVQLWCVDDENEEYARLSAGEIVDAIWPPQPVLVIDELRDAAEMVVGVWNGPHDGRMERDEAVEPWIGALEWLLVSGRDERWASPRRRTSHFICYQKALSEGDIIAARETCLSCGEQKPRDECPNSKRDCGHHCDHSWTHDECCWCGAAWGENGVRVSGRDE